MHTSDEATLLSACPPDLLAITKKVIEKNRLTIDEGLSLFSTPHLAFLQQLADFSRYRAVGDTVFYASTLHIYPTNLCELSCPMCSFYAKPGQKKAWFLSPTMIEEKVRTALPFGISEVHIVGGLWRECTLNYYKETFSRIKMLNSSLHIKALTPVEYEFLARNHGISIQEVLQKMISWGLSSLPGGGAEILTEEIREKIAPGKISSSTYLEVHKIAHSLGLSSNITMLFGHIEDEWHLIDHLDKIRKLQDQTHGFHTFVPLKYHPHNNALGRISSRLKEKDSRRVYAISRLMLDNIPHIKVLWNYVGLQMAVDLLSWGGNDLGSVASGEQVAVMAGGIDAKMTEKKFEEVIHSAGRIPRKVDSGATTNNPS
jgi:aminodeoxyfutalosine synthase